MSDVERLAEVLAEIRVEGARRRRWWTGDQNHALLIRVLRAECQPWAEAVITSRWFRGRLVEAAREGAVTCLCSEDVINAVGCTCGAKLRRQYIRTYDPWGLTREDDDGARGHAQDVSAREEPGGR